MVTVFCSPLTELKRQRINSPQYRMSYSNYSRYYCTTYLYMLPYYFVVGNPQNSSYFGHYIVSMTANSVTPYPLFPTKKFGTTGIVKNGYYALVYSGLSALQLTSYALNYLGVA